MGTTTEPSVEPVTLGLTFHQTWPDGARYEYTVTESCGATAGRWYCVTHNEAFPHNFAKDIHIGRGQHVLAWICFEHDAEVP